MKGQQRTHSREFKKEAVAYLVVLIAIGGATYTAILLWLGRGRYDKSMEIARLTGPKPGITGSSVNDFLDRVFLHILGMSEYDDLANQSNGKKLHTKDDQ